MYRAPEKLVATAAFATGLLLSTADAQTGGTSYDATKRPASPEHTQRACPRPERLKNVSARCANYLMRELRSSVYDDADDYLSVATYQKMTHGKLAVDGDLGPMTARSILSGFKMQLRKPAAATHRDHLVVDKSDQVMYAVKNGSLRHVVSISSGTEQPYRERGQDGSIEQGIADTPTGTWRIYDEAGADFEGNLGSMPYALKYDSANGIFVHAGNVAISGRQSHGCIRVAPATHNTIRNEYGIGDLVTVRN
jgi:lipoprotein-anchoring transpeptidase ErfK/SrfK